MKHALAVGSFSPTTWTGPRSHTLVLTPVGRPEAKMRNAEDASASVDHIDTMLLRAVRVRARLVAPLTSLLHNRDLPHRQWGPVPSLQGSLSDSPRRSPESRNQNDPRPLPHASAKPPPRSIPSPGNSHARY